MQEFRAEITAVLKKNRPHLTDNSLKSYLSTLCNLPRKYGGENSVAWILHNTEHLIKELKDIEPSKRRSIYASLFVLTKCPKIKIEMDADLKTVNGQYREQKKSATEAKNWESWEEIKAKYNEMTIEANKLWKLKTISPEERYFLSQFVLFSFFALMPPRRVLEFSLLKFGGKKNPNKAFNYVSKDAVEWNVYKTMKTYGQQTFPLPAELATILAKWRRINDSEFVILNRGGVGGGESCNITKMLNDIFKPNKISADLLRHAFITDFLGKNPPLVACDNVAKMMGHSVNQQVLYKKVD